MIQQINDAGLKFIENWESLSLNEYLDVRGLPTIGYGHLVLPSDTFTSPITLQFANDLFKKDIEVWVNYLNNKCNHYQLSFNHNQFNALVSFCFNLGSFKSPAMLARLASKNYTDIGNAIKLYDKANHVYIEGLHKRRLAEFKLYFTAA